MSAQVAADLRAAADVLERDGWIQGDYHLGGCHCAVGAIEVATGYWSAEDAPFVPDATKRRTACRDLLGQFLDLEPGGIFPWNDDENRTADEVIAALRAAADRAAAAS